MTGRIHSFQSLGASDGPGVRCVLFMQGCPLRCSFCHNPDTWSCDGGTEVSCDEIFEKVQKYRNYFRSEGGLTVSGGEPLMQADFVLELFEKCKAAGISTVLDTSGSIMPKELERLLDVTDLVLLDYKMTTDYLMKKHIGISLETVDNFLTLLQTKNVPVWLRQVIIKGINDDHDNIFNLNRLLNRFSVIIKTELLPFRKLCVTKYDMLGIPFPLGDYPETEFSEINKLQKMLVR